MILRNPQKMMKKETTLWFHGNISLTDEPLSALLCSARCPGAKILEAHDLAQRWRAENRPVISGFHTAVEKKCLRIFLRGPQHVAICPARCLDPFQLPIEWQPKFDRRELLILSPFDSSIHRPPKILPRCGLVSFSTSRLNARSSSRVPAGCSIDFLKVRRWSDLSQGICDWLIINRDDFWARLIGVRVHWPSVR